MKLRKVIIPAAGLGKRMYPAAKVIPKEMLPIAGKPAIQHVLEEIIEAGFEEIILITNPNKSSIKEHLNFILSSSTRSKSASNISITSVKQGKPKGLGHAILQAEKIIKKEPFAVVLPDMLLQNSNKKNNLALMKKNFDSNNTSGILFSSASKKDIPLYGIAKIKKIKDFPGRFLVKSIIEKPTIKKAPSNLFAVGRYIFRNELMQFLRKAKSDQNEEIQLTDAIDSFIKDGADIHGYNLKGKVYDCGSKLGFLIANIEYSKKDPEIGYHFRKYIKKDA
tara:strand:- start:1982 stop:2818 length:837 start_codon:yes stop_codon:yes gene_type:complete